MTPFGTWLAEIGLGRYDDVFVSNGIDFDVIRSLSDGDLRELGLTLGDRKRLVQAIARLDEQPTADTVALVVAPAPASGLLRDEAVSLGGERRQLTVMFCDLVGSTALSEKLDPEELRSLLHAYRVLCGDVIARYDGFVARYVGDGILTYFGWPIAHEEDAERAVRAALEIVHTVKQASSTEDLAVRIGIATGPVVVGEAAGTGDQSKLAVGSTPNLAARLQALATAGQIVIAASSRRLVGNVFELTDLGEHDLKGIAEPVRCWRVERALVTESRFDSNRGDGALTPLVGREVEVDLLLSRWSQANDGEGQVVLLSGEPGIGKSRILNALRERLEAQGVQALRFQCSPYYVNSAFWPVIDNFERALKFTRDETTDAKLDKLEALIVTQYRPAGGRRPVHRVDLVHPLRGALRGAADDAAEAQGRDAADLGGYHRSGRPQAAQHVAVRGRTLGRPHHTGGVGPADRPGENRAAAGRAHPPAGVSVAPVAAGPCRRAEPVQARSGAECGDDFRPRWRQGATGGAAGADPDQDRWRAAIRRGADQVHSRIGRADGGRRSLRVQLARLVPSPFRPPCGTR